MRVRSIVGTISGMAIAIAFSGCSMIDEDQSDCGKQAEIDYELQLVTNMSTELETVLNTETDFGISQVLRDYLGNIFTDYAHDVDLSFYDTQGDSLRLQHDQHIMDANQASYTLNLPMRKYMHLAVANVMRDNTVSLESDDLCHWSKLQQSASDTVSSHTTGFFTARQPMEVLEGVDQSFNVRLFMANCAAALVLDPKGHDISGIKVYTTGFATGFNICDSAYTFPSKSPVVRTVPLADKGGKMAFCSVNFPSREPRNTRTIIETTEPFISQEGEESLWEVRVYVPNTSPTRAETTTTETVLSLRTPLRGGELKVITGYVGDDGAIRTFTPGVGVSITLDWKPGSEYHSEL